MNYTEIFESVVNYELTHRVEDYVVDGWHVWPFLRSAVCNQWLTTDNPKNNIAKSIARPLWKILRYLKVLYKDILISNKTNKIVVSDLIEVLFLTISERRVSLNGVFYDIYFDPFLEYIHQGGFNTLVFDEGKYVDPKHSHSINISNLLYKKTLKYSLVSKKNKEPKWFSEYQILLNKVIGRQVSWGEIDDKIKLCTNQSLVIESWLKSTNLKLLFLVGWYNSVPMAFTLAAHRCGIKTIDFQHGVQGVSHFAYSSWFKTPKNGYEVVPNIFWCWGKTSADDLIANNPSFSEKIIAIGGGNLWLNQWLNIKKSTSSFVLAENKYKNVRRVIVSLNLDVCKLLIDAIAASPENWVWMIRFHPSRKIEDRIIDMEKLNSTGHQNIDFDRANKQLLYELFNDCDVHVTEVSTCSLEALAFGIQSVIIGSSDLGKEGKKAYSNFIEKKLMLTTDTMEGLIDAIRSAIYINPESQVIADYFSSNDTAKVMLDKLLLK